MKDTLLEMIKPVTVIVIKELIILFVGFFVIKYLLKLLKRGFEKSKKLDPMLHTFFINAFKIVFWTSLVLIMLKTAGMDVTSFLAIFAAAGAAIALALKDSLSNFAGGILLMITRPFGKGDYIESSGNAGTVDSIDLLYTTIITIDNKTVTLPNGQVANSSVTNYTKRGTRRIDLEVGISYESDYKKAREVLFELADADSRIMKEPEKMCGVLEYADSAVILAFRVWVKSSEYWDVYFSLQNQIKDALAEAGISIPFPQVDVHFDKQQ